MAKLKPNELRRLAEFFATYEIYSLAASYDPVNLPPALKECTDGGWEPSPAFSKALEEAIERHGLDGIWIVGDSDTYHRLLLHFSQRGRIGCDRWMEHFRLDELLITPLTGFDAYGKVRAIASMTPAMSQANQISCSPLNKGGWGGHSAILQSSE